MQTYWFLELRFFPFVLVWIKTSAALNSPGHRLKRNPLSFFNVRGILTFSSLCCGSVFQVLLQSLLQRGFIFKSAAVLSLAVHCTGISFPWLTGRHRRETDEWENEDVDFVVWLPQWKGNSIGILRAINDQWKPPSFLFWVAKVSLF